MEACKKPCNECPFTKTSMRGWLANYTPESLHGIVMSEQPFPCHMLHDEQIEWEDAGTSQYPICAGSLRYMKKGAKQPRNLELKKLVSNLTLNDCKNILSIPEFFEHHKPL